MINLSVKSVYIILALVVILISILATSVIIDILLDSDLHRTSLPMSQIRELKTQRTLCSIAVMMGKMETIVPCYQESLKSPIIGQLYYNTSNHKFYVYIGWQELEESKLWLKKAHVK